MGASNYGSHKGQMQKVKSNLTHMISNKKSDPVKKAKKPDTSYATYKTITASGVHMKHHATQMGKTQMLMAQYAGADWTDGYLAATHKNARCQHCGSYPKHLEVDYSIVDQGFIFTALCHGKMDQVFVHYLTVKASDCCLIFFPKVQGVRYENASIPGASWEDF